ncbi:hypothetical protein OG609_34575 [Streptomyces sp. NBC_01224]|uniref:hypothetical protein n=1 Tax=Streptomyces sp. NBC_01224 TaxID=2903783 RepID=UPI002E0E7019|nr:hypothetical protein OG609_34575 [Streptomyces sp. NBC_01224]
MLLFLLVAEHLVHQKFARLLPYAVAVTLLVVVQIEVGVRLHRGDRAVPVLDDQPGADGARLESLVVVVAVDDLGLDVAADGHLAVGVHRAGCHVTADGEDGVGAPRGRYRVSREG